MRYSIWLLAAVLVSGCTPEGNGDGGGGGAGGGGGDAGPGPGPDEAAFRSAIAAYFCAYIRTCRPPDDDFHILRLFALDGGDCETWFAGRFETFGSPIESGDARADQAAFERCSRRALDHCAEIDEVAGCRDALVGLRMAGEPCPDSDVCAPSLYCEYGGPAPEDDPDACTDRCTARRAPGDPCDYDEQCADEADRAGFCDDDDEGNNGTCGTLRLRNGAAVGQQCGFVNDEGGPTRVHCAAGSVCFVDNRRSSGACQAPPQVGDPCPDNDIPCEGGFCIDGTCVALDIGSTPGDPCDERQLQLCNPFARLVCVNGVCTESDGSQGAPCADGDGGVPCDDGLYCGVENTCDVPAADGAPCDPFGDDAACVSAYCERQGDGDSGICAPDPFVDGDDRCR